MENNKPDVILYDSVMIAARILAGIWKIPVIQTRPQFSYYYGFYSKEICTWFDYPLTDSFCERINSEILRIHPVAKLNIYYIPRSFQPNEQLFDERFFFSGPSFLQKPLNDRQKRERSENRKTILISVSASRSRIVDDIEYFKIFVNALSGSQWKVILSIGDRIDPLSLGPLPLNFEINQHTPQSEIIPYTSLFIGGGGFTSTFEALYHGVPLIVIPQDAMCLEPAYRVALTHYIPA